MGLGWDEIRASRGDGMGSGQGQARDGIGAEGWARIERDRNGVDLGVWGDSGSSLSPGCGAEGAAEARTLLRKEVRRSKNWEK